MIKKLILFNIFRMSHSHESRGFGNFWVNHGAWGFSDYTTPHPLFVVWQQKTQFSLSVIYNKQIQKPASSLRPTRGCRPSCWPGQPRHPSLHPSRSKQKMLNLQPCIYFPLHTSLAPPRMGGRISMLQDVHRSVYGAVYVLSMIYAA